MENDKLFLSMGRLSSDSPEGRVELFEYITYRSSPQAVPNGAPPPKDIVFKISPYQLNPGQIQRIDGLYSLVLSAPIPFVNPTIDPIFRIVAILAHASNLNTLDSKALPIARNFAKLYADKHNLELVDLMPQNKPQPRLSLSEESIFEL